MKIARLRTYWVEGMSLVLLLASIFFFVGAQQFRRSISNHEPEQFVKGDLVRVVEVIDGDEVLVEKGESRAVVRLEGIESFEAGASDPLLAEYGKIARFALRAQIQGKTATLDLAEKRLDLKGRLLGRLWLNGGESEKIDPGLQLIRDGYAVTFTRFEVAHQDEYLAAEQDAREAPRGFWSDDSIRARIDAMKLRWEEEARND